MVTYRSSCKGEGWSKETEVQERSGNICELNNLVNMSLYLHTFTISTKGTSIALWSNVCAATAVCAERVAPVDLIFTHACQSPKVERDKGNVHKYRNYPGYFLRCWRNSPMMAAACAAPFGLTSAAEGLAGVTRASLARGARDDFDTKVTFDGAAARTVNILSRSFRVYLCASRFGLVTRLFGSSLSALLRNLQIFFEKNC